MMSDYNRQSLWVFDSKSKIQRLQLEGFEPIRNGFQEVQPIMTGLTKFGIMQTGSNELMFFGGEDNDCE